ncbi:galactose mutarotase-like domain-containing protein, partial [Phlyctochytrium arcticum]
DPAKVVVTHGDSTADIYYYGATVTSWKVHGLERIFLSSNAILNGTKAIRGGIPLVFPHFGTIPTSKLPQHGFARNSKWRWVGATKDTAAETVVAFELTPENVPENLRELWQHVAEIATVAVAGLTGSAFVDKVTGGTTQNSEDRERVTVASEVDRVYEGVKGDAITIQGTAIGVVWNPWVDKAKAMADFGDEEYHNMICVEVGHVAQPVELKPGETWTGGQTLVAV